ncbi:uncharacterized protein si:ch211-159e12.5 isoform X2 [Dunckerocampus dactyliophorus]|uniref:uncharacterized protein si:ch211-159e12.5 isoform X2 n=1 Tax=Dunckerocampus dactyliophorus TaxID=161453 RepID=UPI0024061C4A|nr:uncharacterized protein si:ch211-159e12.5 isoform X2 [Dunckerocampus dactyliophorus]
MSSFPSSRRNEPLTEGCKIQCTLWIYGLKIKGCCPHTIDMVLFLAEIKRITIMTETTRSIIHQQDLGDYDPSEVRECSRANYERGYLREGWQRRWEASKRDSSSYRELEAWAARYSHSLPRRRRIESELRGASQGLLERRTGIGSCMVTEQQVGQCVNIRHDPAHWEIASPEAPNTSHVVDIKGQIGFQRKIFSQPPDYIAPPPYNTQHKSSSVMPHYGINLVQVERTQDKPGKKQKTDLERITNLSSQVYIPQELLPQQAVQRRITEASSKVIEGRKFRLSKKTGGMTIFCLVSRIAGPTESPSLTPPANTEVGNCSMLSTENNPISKVADEVDKTQTNMSDLTKTKQMAPCCKKSVAPEEKLLKDKTDDATFEKQSAQLIPPVRYPLWKEPSFTRTLKGAGSPLGMEVRRLDIKKGPESEEGQDLLVIDTTCVVVKMELIQSPKKEHVHLLEYPENSPSSPVQSEGLKQDLYPDPNTELNYMPQNTRLKGKLDPDLEKEVNLEIDSENPTQGSLEKNTERILRTSLDASSGSDGVMKNELDSSLVNNSEMKEKLSKDTTKEEEQSQNQQDPNKEKMSVDWVKDISCGKLSESQQHVEAEINSQPGTNDLLQVETSENATFECTQVGDKSEQRWAKNQSIEKDAGLFVTSPPLPLNSLLPPSSLDDGASNPTLIYSLESLPSISESETEEGPDAEQGTLDPVADGVLQPGTASLLTFLIPPADPSVIASKSDTDASEDTEEGQTSLHEEVYQESPTDGTGAQPFEGDRVQMVSDISIELVEQMSAISKEEPSDFNNEQQELLCIQAEDRNKTEDDNLGQISTEKCLTERQIKSLVVQTEENVDVKETNKEPLEDNKDLTGLEEEMIECQNDKQDTKALFKLLSPPSPSDSNHEAQPQAPSPQLDSKEDLAPHVETGSTENPHETVTAPLLLPEFIPSSETSPPPPGNCVPPDQPQGEGLHYPNSLWDAVNRIRKHTAPDSENEEEEVTEFWDPERVEGVPDIFEELEVSEDTEVGQMLPHPWREEDTFSCSSTSSHDSGDTVVVADEVEVEQTEEVWRGCLGEVNNANSEGEGGGDDKRDEYQTEQGEDSTR